jgi:hypothetical protein
MCASKARICPARYNPSQILRPFSSLKGAGSSFLFWALIYLADRGVKTFGVISSNVVRGLRSLLW